MLKVLLLGAACALPASAEPPRVLAGLEASWNGPAAVSRRARRRMERRRWPFDAEKAKAVWGHEAQLAELAETSRALGDTFTFSIIGDAEPGRFWFERLFPPRGKKVFESQMMEMRSRPHDFVLQLGDFVSRGTNKNYAEFIEKLERVADRPFFPLLGNHDRAKTYPKEGVDRSLYEATFPGGNPIDRNTDFSFDRGGYRFVCLDSADGALDAVQLDWLDGVLDTELRTVVATHIPPVYLKGRWVKPEEIPAGEFDEEAFEQKVGRGYFTGGAADFARIVAKHRVERVYVGHLHALAYAEFLGVRYVLSGGGGSPLYTFKKMPGRKVSHYIMVEAGPSGLKETIVSYQGGEDSFAADDESLALAD